MNATERQQLRTFVRQCLDEAGDADDFSDADSLFVSGRLDSLALTRLVLFLEDRHGLDFGALDFSAELLDSIDAMAALVQPSMAAGR